MASQMSSHDMCVCGGERLSETGGQSARFFALHCDLTAVPGWPLPYCLCPQGMACGILLVCLYNI